MVLSFLPAFLPALPEGILRLLHSTEGTGVELANLNVAHHRAHLELVTAALQNRSTFNRAYHKVPLPAAHVHREIRRNLVTHRLLNDRVDVHGQVRGKKDVYIAYGGFERGWDEGSTVS